MPSVIYILHRGQGSDTNVALQCVAGEEGSRPVLYVVHLYLHGLCRDRAACSFYCRNKEQQVMPRQVDCPLALSLHYAKTKCVTTSVLLRDSG